MEWLIFVVQIKNKKIMKTKIKEIQDYFKAELLNGNFTVIEKTQFWFLIEIEGYQFSIWVGNSHIPETRKQGATNYQAFDLDLSENDAIALHNIMDADIKAFRRDVLIAEKRAELEKLEAL